MSDEGKVVVGLAALVVGLFVLWGYAIVEDGREREKALASYEQNCHAAYTDDQCRVLIALYKQGQDAQHAAEMAQTNAALAAGIAAGSAGRR